MGLSKVMKVTVALAAQRHSTLSSFLRDEGEGWGALLHWLCEFALGAMLLIGVIASTTVFALFLGTSGCKCDV